MTPIKSIRLHTLEELPQAAEAVLDSLQGRTLVLFRGAMGAGKTTLIRALCEQLGVEDTVTSPTFALVNEYRDREGDSVYHFDFYRIDRPEEALDLGYEEYFDSGHLCLVEWPEKIETLLPQRDLLEVQLDILGEESRQITLTSR